MELKLLNILKEIQPPSPDKLYIGEPEDKNDEFIRRGYRTKPINTPGDEETGTISSEVEYLPKIEQIKNSIIKYRKEFQPFKFSSNPDISKIAKEINTNLTKLANMMFALDKMIELERKK